MRAALLLLLLSIPVGALCQDGWRYETGPGAWTGRIHPNAVVFNDRVWVFNGINPVTFADLWSSPDGTSWTQDLTLVPWFYRHGCVSEVFDSRLWMIGGVSGGAIHGDDVWSSPDGINWTEEVADAPWNGRAYHSGAVFDGRIWILGGQESRPGPDLMHSDVWSSPDGVNWAQEVGAAGWTPREGHATVVFNNKLWVLGGWDFDHLNDVWSSPDGVNWTQELAAAPWEPRAGHTATVFRGRIWVIGGFDVNDHGLMVVHSDVWSSADGVVWRREVADAQMVEREEHASFVFRHRLWVLGGAGGGTTRDDAWSYGLHIAPAKLPSGVLEVPYSRDFEARLGTGPFDWSLVGGSLPPGLSLGTSATDTVAVSGTPLATGTYQFTVRVEDQGTGDWAEETITLTIKPQFTNKEEAQAGACTAAPSQPGTGGQGTSTAVLWLAWLAALTAATIALRRVCKPAMTPGSSPATW